MTITYGQFRYGLRFLLPDTAQWRDTMLLQWTQEALEDLALKLPFHDVCGIDCGDGVRQYLLNAITNESLMDVLSVEYPTGQSPRRFLSHLEERHPSFLGGAYYDVNKQDMTIPTAHSELFFLVLGESPVAGESIWFEYTRYYARPTLDGDLLMVPENVLPTLRMYVLWKAAQSLELDESISLQRKTDMLRALGGSAQETFNTYRWYMESLNQRLPGSLTARWTMDEDDRVY